MKGLDIIYSKFTVLLFQCGGIYVTICHINEMKPGENPFFKAGSGTGS